VQRSEDSATEPHLG